MKDFHDIPEPQTLTCWTCGGEMKEYSSNPDTIFLHCPQCSKELTRLADIESYIEELQLRYNNLLHKYEVLSQLERDLQDFIKTLTK